MCILVGNQFHVLMVLVVSQNSISSSTLQKEQALVISNDAT